MKSITMSVEGGPSRLRRLGGALALTLLAHAASANPPLLPPRAKERVQPQPSKALEVMPGAQEQALFAPFPRRFELGGASRHFEAFAVTQTGPIRVALRAEGPPVNLVLRRPDGRVIERQGQGEIVIEDVAGNADLAAGSVWNIAVIPLRRDDSPGAVARGELSVKAPEADARLVQAEIGRAQAQSAAAANALRAQAPTSGDAAAETLRQQRALEQASLARHTNMLQQLQTQLTPQATAAVQQSLALRGQGRTVAQAEQAVAADPRITAAAVAGAPMRADRALARDLAAATPATMPAAPAAGPAAASPAAPTGTAAMNSSAGQPASPSPFVAGAINRLLKPGAMPSPPPGQSGQPAQGAQAAPQGPPVIRSLSVTEGDPGTPLMLSGTNLGDQKGEVRFVVASGQDLPAPVSHWTPTQILLQVPAVEGVGPYNGHVYVRRADRTQSEFRPFSFRPTLEVRTIHPRFDGDATVHPFALANVGFFGYGWKLINREAPVWGGSGRDEFFKGRQLRNGWKVERCFATPGHRASWGPGSIVSYGTGEVSVHCQPGSAMLDTGTNWWIGWGSQLVYSVGVVVTGPKGLEPL